MGKVLAVSPGFARCVALSMAVIGTALAGCGNDTSRTEGPKIALDVAKGLKAKILPGRKAANAAHRPDPEAMAAAAMGSFPGPLILAEVERMGVLNVLGEYGRNGATRTYATSNEQTLTFRQGLLVATRGLGNDLMSADPGAAADLVSRRRAGQTARIYRYLDGEGIERPLPMRCDIVPGSAKSFAFAGSNYDTMEMTETCRSQRLRIANSYWVTSGGTIALSRQWIGPALGHVTIQLVRP